MYRCAVGMRCYHGRGNANLGAMDSIILQGGRSLWRFMAGKGHIWGRVEENSSADERLTEEGEDNEGPEGLRGAKRSW